MSNLVVNGVGRKEICGERESISLSRSAFEFQRWTKGELQRRDAIFIPWRKLQRPVSQCGHEQFSLFTVTCNRVPYFGIFLLKHSKNKSLYPRKCGESEREGREQFAHGLCSATSDELPKVVVFSIQCSSFATGTVPRFPLLGLLVSASWTLGPDYSRSRKKTRRLVHFLALSVSLPSLPAPLSRSPSGTGWSQPILKWLPKLTDQLFRFLFSRKISFGFEFAFERSRPQRSRRSRRRRDLTLSPGGVPSF